MKKQSIQLYSSPLAIKVEGSVVSSNFEDISSKIQAFLEGINYAPVSDADFGESIEIIKALKLAEVDIKEAGENALEDAAPIYALVQAMDERGEAVRQARLSLERKVDAKREEIREECVQAGLDLVDNDSHWRQTLIVATKGKKKRDTMMASVMVSVAQILEDRKGKSKVIDAAVNEYGETIGYGRAEMLRNPLATVEREIESRISAHKAAEEKAKAAAEEKAKAAADHQETSLEGLVLSDETVKKMEEKMRADQPEGQTAEQEWTFYKAKVKAVFLPLGEASKSLQHEENREKSKAFGKAINESWSNLNVS